MGKNTNSGQLRKSAVAAVFALRPVSGGSSRCTRIADLMLVSSPDLYLSRCLSIFNRHSIDLFWSSSEKGNSADKSWPIVI